MNISTPLVFALSAVAILGSVECRGALIDQNLLLPQAGQPTGGFGGYPILEGVQLGQSFEVGITGVLDRIDVQFAFNTATDFSQGLEFSLYALTESGLPTGSPVASSVLQAPSDVDPMFPGHYTLSLDFSGSDFFVAAGESFALVTESDGLPGVWGTWVSEVFDGSQFIRGDRYGNGSGLLNGPGTNGDWVDYDEDPFLVFDLGMATYVRPVPLPSAVFLFLSGIGALAFARSTGSREQG